MTSETGQQIITRGKGNHAVNPLIPGGNKRSYVLKETCNY